MRDKPRKYDIGDGRQVTVAELAKKTGINKTTLRARLNSGWTGDQLMTPPRKPDDVPVYDFGNGHHLTIAQASKLAGISSNMIYNRIRYHSPRHRWLTKRVNDRKRGLTPDPHPLGTINPDEPRYSVSPEQKLTVAQIVAITGISEAIIRQHIRLGIRGRAPMRPIKNKR